MSTLLLPSNSSLAPCTSTTHITAKSLGDHGRAGQFKFGLHDAVLLSNGRLRCKHYRTKGILNVIICASVDNIATTLSRRRTDRSLTFQVSNFSGPPLLPRKTRTTPASTHFNFYCDQQGWKHWNEARSVNFGKRGFESFTIFESKYWWTVIVIVNSLRLASITAHSSKKDIDIDIN